MGDRRCCCPEPACGCPEFENCLVPGEFLVATISSECEELDGIVRYFVVGEEQCWVALQDGGYGSPGCLILNPGPGHEPTRICCDDNREHCPENEGCSRYYIELRAYECNDFTIIKCADACSCGESGVGFYLDFNDLVLDGSPREVSGGQIIYLCGCECQWPVTISIHVDRLVECCCPNLETQTPAPTLYAEITLPGGSACDIEASTELGTQTTANGCRVWEAKTAMGGSALPLEFTCGGNTKKLDLTMTCVHSESPVSGGCCDDYQLEVSLVAGFDEDCVLDGSPAGVVGDCECLPLLMTFGPFSLKNNGGTECDCCEEFYITVTDTAPA